MGIFLSDNLKKKKNLKNDNNPLYQIQMNLKE